MKTRLFIASGLFILSSWTMPQRDNIKIAEWLIGTWENKTSRGTIFENWNKVDENEFAGRSYMLREEDTVIFENIRLIQEEKGLFYAPVVKEQNKGQAVRFALKSISEMKIVFENPQHDFPQIISYSKISSDSLVAEIYGTKNGQFHKVRFPMKRVR